MGAAGDHDDGVFDATVAARYDEAASSLFEPAVLEPTVGLLVELAQGRPVLELAVGTGRVAIPLAQRGLEVAGIELSQAMADQLQAKSGAERVAVTVGDMTTTCLGRRFGLVYLVDNTITNLLTQHQQVACFVNAAEHLEPGGHFVIEVFVPPLRRLPPGERFVPFAVDDDHVGIDSIDVVSQQLVSHHHWVGDGPATVFESPHRYVWPAELDLMAQLAGLAPTHRWADWKRDPFSADSTSHVSVWTRPA